MEECPKTSHVSTKSKNTPDSDDLRLWLTDKRRGEHNRQLSDGQVGRTGFLPNIARMLYGLLIMEREQRLSFVDIMPTKIEEVREIWNNEPFALVETKKLTGYASVSLQEIKNPLHEIKIF